jgi:hypothetical protein
MRRYRLIEEKKKKRSVHASRRGAIIWLERSFFLEIYYSTVVA